MALIPPTPAELAEDERRALENTVRAGRATILALIAHLRNAPQPRPDAPRGPYTTWWEATQKITSGYEVDPRRGVAYHLPVRFDAAATRYGDKPHQVSEHEFVRLCGHPPTWPWPGMGESRDWVNEAPSLVVPNQAGS